MQKTIKKQLNKRKNFLNIIFLIKGGVLSVLLLVNLIMVNTVFAKDTQKHANYSGLEREIINQLNQERAKNQLNALRFNSKLKAGAEIKLKDLLDNEYFAHTSPKGVKAWDILANVGYDYKYAGENLAMKFEDAKSVHDAWMKSKKHRENILFKNYTEVAVAVGVRKGGSLVAVEFFGKPIALVTPKEKEILKPKTENNNVVSGMPTDVEGAVKYTSGTGNLLTQIIPDGRVEYEKKKNITEIASTKLSPDQVIGLNNMALLVVGAVCLILVVNIWVLEKEEERIIAEAKQMCQTKKILTHA